MESDRDQDWTPANASRFKTLGHSNAEIALQKSLEVVKHSPKVSAYQLTVEFSSPSPLTRKFRNSEEETLSEMSHADDLVAPPHHTHNTLFLRK